MRDMGYVEDLTRIPSNGFEKNQKARAEKLVSEFETEAFVEAGVVRWKSNNSVPPTEILDLWKHVGKPFDMEKSLASREADTTKFIAEYRERMKNYPHSPEELAEMRVAFGPGAEVVNIITGKKTKL